MLVGGQRIKLGGGDFFGEMALISGQPRSADVTAVDFTKLLILDRRDFREFLRKYPGIREQVSTLAAQWQEMNRLFQTDDAVLPTVSPETAASRAEKKK